MGGQLVIQPRRIRTDVCVFDVSSHSSGCGKKLALGWKEVELGRDGVIVLPVLPNQD